MTLRSRRGAMRRFSVAACVVLAGAAVGIPVARVRAQSAPERGAADAPPARTDEPPKVVFDPQLVQRLTGLQAQRRRRREQELKDADGWAQKRGQRASEHRAMLGAIWGSLVDSPDGQAALRIHADRMARLNRMLDVAEQAADPITSKRVRADIETELAHHARAMQTLRAELGL